MPEIFLTGVHVDQGGILTLFRGYRAKSMLQRNKRGFISLLTASRLLKNPA